MNEHSTQSGLEISPGAPTADQSLAQVLHKLWADTETLLRQEFALARTEFEVKMRKLKAEAAGVAIGAAFLYGSLLAFFAALVLLLAEVVAPWLAALIVSAGLGGIGLVLVKRNTKISKEDVTPTQTIESVKEDVRTFKEATQ